MGMNRRDFVKSTAAAAVAVGIDAEALKPMAKTKAGMPNVLYVFSDQHRAVSLPGEPFDEAIAPNIDAFRRANFSMDTCVSNYPLCTPYRAILQTGRYSCQTGMVENSLALKTSEVTIGTTFRAAGYHTGYIGKWHLGNDAHWVPEGPLRHGYEHWEPWADTNKHYSSYTYDATGKKIFPAGWNATRMTDQAVDFVSKQPKDKPWLLMVSWNPPHPPFDPPAEDQKPYEGKMKRRPNVQIVGHGKGPLRDDADWHKAIQGYYGGITGVDAEFGRILKALEESGQADNTIVIYTSDHGEMMGSQGRMSKQVPFEESCRVPFAVRYPGVVVKGRTDMLFGAIDIFPTVCGLAGLPVPPSCVGRDHSPVMKGGKMEPSEMVFLMNGGADAMLEKKVGAKREEQEAQGDEGHAPAYRGVKTKTHTYAVDLQGRWLLYDNVADPYQMNNLTKDPAHKPLMDKLDASIHAWMKMTGDPFAYPAVS